MTESHRIIKVYTTVNPAEIALLENEFLENDIEYRVNDDTNFLSGLSLQLVYIREADLEKAADIITRFYTEGVLTDPGPGAKLGKHGERVRAVEADQHARIRRDEKEARGPMLRKFLFYVMLFAGGSLLYELFKFIGLL